MSQYDFGTIDPYTDDGVTLADMLNNWRDAGSTGGREMGRGARRFPPSPLSLPWSEVTLPLWISSERSSRAR